MAFPFTVPAYSAVALALPTRRLTLKEILLPWHWPFSISVSGMLAAIKTPVSCPSSCVSRSVIGVPLPRDHDHDPEILTAGSEFVRLVAFQATAFGPLPIFPTSRSPSILAE